MLPAGARFHSSILLCLCQGLSLGHVLDLSVSDTCEMTGVICNGYGVACLGGVELGCGLGIFGGVGVDWVCPIAGGTSGLCGALGALDSGYHSGLSSGVAGRLCGPTWVQAMALCSLMALVTRMK